MLSADPSPARRVARRQGPGRWRTCATRRRCASGCAGFRVSPPPLAPEPLTDQLDITRRDSESPRQPRLRHRRRPALRGRAPSGHATQAHFVGEEIARAAGTPIPSESTTTSFGARRSRRHRDSPALCRRCVQRPSEESAESATRVAPTPSVSGRAPDRSGGLCVKRPTWLGFRARPHDISSAAPTPLRRPIRIVPTSRKLLLYTTPAIEHATIYGYGSFRNYVPSEDDLFSAGATPGTPRSRFGCWPSVSQKHQPAKGYHPPIAVTTATDAANLAVRNGSRLRAVIERSARAGSGAFAVDASPDRQSLPARWKLGPGRLADHNVIPRRQSEWSGDPGQQNPMKPPDLPAAAIPAIPTRAARPAAPTTSNRETPITRRPESDRRRGRSSSSTEFRASSSLGAAAASGTTRARHPIRHAPRGRRTRNRRWPPQPRPS